MSLNIIRLIALVKVIALACLFSSVAVVEAGEPVTYIIVDGDTIRTVYGQRLQLYGILAPRLGSFCKEERERALLAAEELRLMLREGPVMVHPILTARGHVRYDNQGRALVRLSNRYGDVGSQLLERRLASPVSSGRHRLCR